jgi:predicted LPLAT superfamily acyltransferase
MPAERKNLSDNRGNTLGIFFFQVMLKILGRTCTCSFVWVIAFFYAVFDRTARRAARPYLESRFPNSSRMQAWWHFYRLIVCQGQVMILAHWLRTGHQVPIREEHPERLRELLLAKERGLILLISHVGCWQAALTYLEIYQRPVNLLIQMNTNTSVARMFSGKHFKIVDNSSPFGGLLECIAAIERGEIVCIMGDRQAGETESAVEMQLLERSIMIPLSPWLLAARCQCAIIPIFTLMRGLARSIDFYFAEPINIDYDLPVKPTASDFEPFVKQYALELEKIAVSFPYQIFHYETLSTSHPIQEIDNG